MENKPFKTLDEQIQILVDKNLIISDTDFAKEKLLSTNYYTLINGYKHLFLDTSSTSEQFKPNIKFEEIYNFYTFDKELKNLLLKYILEFETSFKSRLAYTFCANNNEMNYLQLSSFNYTCANGVSNNHKVRDILSLISNLQASISKGVQNNSKIKHFITNYGYVPFWVLVTDITLGTANIFYSHMDNKAKNDIAREFNVMPNFFESSIKLLVLYRNATAHNERIFCYNVRSGVVNFSTNTHNNYCTQFNAKFNVDTNHKKDLFTVTCLLKLYLPKESFSNFINEFENLFDSLYKFYGNDVTRLHEFKSSLQSKVNFPTNWREIKDI